MRRKQRVMAWPAYMVPSLGLMPPIPAMRKYVFLRSKMDESASAVTVAAALISEGSENQRGYGH